MSSGRRGASSHGGPGRPSQAGRSAVFRPYTTTHPGLDAHAASLSAVASSALVRLVAQRRAGERLRSGRSREPGQRSAPRTAAASVQGAHPRPCALWRVPSKSLRPPKEPMPPEAHQRPGRGDWQTPSTRRQCHQHRRRLGGAGAAWRRVLGPAGSGARRHALPKPSRLARVCLGVRAALRCDPRTP